MTISPYGFTVFCDDIRHEADGKRSFIGTYSGSMIVHGQFPALIPKFAAAITFNEPNDLSLTRTTSVIIHILTPGETIETCLIKLEAPPISQQQKDQNEENRKNLDSAGITMESAEIPLTRFDMNFMWTPLVLPTPGWIRIRAKYNNEIIRLGSLRVEPTGLPPT